MGTKATSHVCMYACVCVFNSKLRFTFKCPEPITSMLWIHCCTLLSLSLSLSFSLYFYHVWRQSIFYFSLSHFLFWLFSSLKTLHFHSFFFTWIFFQIYLNWLNPLLSLPWIILWSIQLNDKLKGDIERERERERERQIMASLSSSMTYGRSWRKLKCTQEKG